MKTQNVVREDSYFVRPKIPMLYVGQQPTETPYSSSLLVQAESFFSIKNALPGEMHLFDTILLVFLLELVRSQMHRETARPMELCLAWTSLQAVSQSRSSSS